MNLREKWDALCKVPAVRTTLFVIGLLLMVASPAAGILPGPGGIIVFAAGLALTLKYSEWAKRKYVEFKRKHPNKGRWADWGLRRKSALRREELRKQEEAERAKASEVARIEREDRRAVLILYRTCDGHIAYSVDRLFVVEEWNSHEYWAPAAFSGLYDDLERARRDGLRELELA